MITPGPKIVFFDTKYAVGIGECAVGMFLVCSSNLALKSIAIIEVLPFSIVISIVLLLIIDRH